MEASESLEKMPKTGQVEAGGVQFFFFFLLSEQVNLFDSEGDSKRSDVTVDPVNQGFEEQGFACTNNFHIYFDWYISSTVICKFPASLWDAPSPKTILSQPNH